MGINTSFISAEKFPLSSFGAEVQFYQSISSIEKEWDALSDGNLMFSTKFFRAIEKAPPSDTNFAYAIVRKNQENFGLIYFQLKQFELAKSLKITPVQGKSKIVTKLKVSASKLVKFNGITCGNMLVTGDFGYQFKETDLDDQFEIVSLVTQILSDLMKKSKQPIGTIMIKDFFEDQRPRLGTAKKVSYTGLKVQPNMLLEIKWQNFEDYLVAIKSKYRVRYKKSIKLSTNIIRRELNLEDMLLFEQRIHELYMSTATEAGFNLFFLHEKYFLELKRQFDDEFKVFAYFEGEKMIAFYTMFLNRKELEAHFLGYDHQLNHQYQIYLNMLYDLLKHAIDHQMNSLNLSRTAMEIKSSVGAHGVDMAVYLKRTNRFQNKLLPKMLDFFVPESSWKSRNPFK